MRKLSFSHDYKMAIDVNVSKNGRILNLLAL